MNSASPTQPTHKNRRANRNGQILLIGMVLLLLLLSLFIPMMVRHTSQDSKQAIRNFRMTRAFNLAEAGLERGAWKLKDDPAVWEMAVAGTPIANFRGDASSVYDEMGGQYKITIGPGPSPGEVSVRSVGRDESTHEVRAVEGVYATGIHQALTTNGNFRSLPDMHVHWGPMASFGTLAVTTNTSFMGGAPASWSNTYYPRKFAKLGITNRDSNPAVPNTDSLEYWAYQNSMGDPPAVDLAYYRARADNNDVPLQSPTGLGSYCPPGFVGQINIGAGFTNCSGGTLAVAHTPGKGLFLRADNPSSDFITLNGYVLRSTSTVMYFDDFFVNHISFLDIEAFILAGPTRNLVLYGGIGEVYNATIPVNAQDEYAHPTAQPIWTMANPPCTELGDPSFSSLGAGNWPYPIRYMNFRGFMYVGGTLEGGGVWGGASMIGALVLAGADVTSQDLYRDFCLFYDESIARNIKLQNDFPRRVSWREIPASW